MNFLAHLHLANDTPASMVGNLMPDLVHGKLPMTSDDEVAEGIVTHRRVDAFTDTHPIFAQSKSYFRHEEDEAAIDPNIDLPSRHFAGILVDIFYDHFLAVDWSRYHEMRLPEFITHAYEQLYAGRELMPEQMRSRMQRIQQQDYLSQYATTQGLHNVLSLMSLRFSERLNRRVRMQNAIPVFLANYQAMRSEFHTFYPQLIEYVAPQIETVSLQY